MNELYITSARTGISREVLKEYPHAGALFKVKTDTEGFYQNRFAG